MGCSEGTGLDNITDEAWGKAPTQIANGSLCALLLVQLPGDLPEDSWLLTRSVSPGVFVHPCPWLVEAALSSDAEIPDLQKLWGSFPGPGAHTRHYALCTAFVMLTCTSCSCPDFCSEAGQVLRIGIFQQCPVSLCASWGQGLQSCKTCWGAQSSFGMFSMGQQNNFL